MAYSGALALDGDTVSQQLPSPQATALVQITGTFSMTVLFEASLDNSNWVAVTGVSGTLQGTSATAVGDWQVNVNGYAYFRCRAHPVTSGTANVVFAFSNEAAVLAYDNISNDGVYLASAARTTTQTQADQVNPGARGIAVTLDMTVVGTGSVTLEIDGKDPASGKYVALLSGAAVVSNVTNTYTIFPGATVTANVSANAELWHTWRIKVTANNANPATYSVGYTLLP